MNFKNVTLTAYYPSDEKDDAMEYLDTKGQALATLQVKDELHFIRQSFFNFIYTGLPR